MQMLRRAVFCKATRNRNFLFLVLKYFRTHGAWRKEIERVYRSARTWVDLCTIIEKVKGFFAKLCAPVAASRTTRSAAIQRPREKGDVARAVGPAGPPEQGVLVRYCIAPSAQWKRRRCWHEIIFGDPRNKPRTPPPTYRLPVHPLAVVRHACALGCLHLRPRRRSSCHRRVLSCDERVPYSRLAAAFCTPVGRLLDHVVICWCDDGFRPGNRHSWPSVW